jgi:lipoate-protein ligase A
LAGDKLRVILQLAGLPADMNMAIDEALLKLRSEGLIPDTLRVYTFNPPAVTIGRFQRLSTSVNMDEALRRGVQVVRRITGGGSVYHDPHGEVTYSIVVGVDRRPGLRDVHESFRLLCSGVVEALRSLGVPAEYKPVNDVVVAGRKVSGNAQARTPTAVLQHGTILYRVDRGAVRALLRAPQEKLRDHNVSDVAERIAGISELTGRHYSPEEIAVALVDSFRRVLGYDSIYVDKLKREEELLARKLLDRYRSRSWLYKR